jgi:hypothetical protein
MLDGGTDAAAELDHYAGLAREAYPGPGIFAGANMPFDAKMVRWRVSANLLTGTAVLGHAPHCLRGSPKRSRTRKG